MTFNKTISAAVWALTALGGSNLPAAIGIKQSGPSLEIQNGKIALNLAKGNEGPLLSYQMGDLWRKAVSLRAFQKEHPAASVKSFKVVKNTPALASVEVEYGFDGGLSAVVTYSIKDGFEYIEAESDFAQGRASIEAEMKSEALALPDFLADSIAQYPEAISCPKLNIPSDNHILVNMLDGGDAMLALLWESEQLNILEHKSDPYFDSLNLSANGKAKFWLGIIAANGIWHTVTEKLNSSEFVALNWEPPFPAEWRLTTFLSKGFYTDKSACESWKFIQRGSDEKMDLGITMVNCELCQAWVPGLCGFIYPCYFLDGKAYARKPAFPNMSMTSVSGELPTHKAPILSDSPCLICAWNENNKTPSDVTMPRNAMGKILTNETMRALEPVSSVKDKYLGTCHSTEKVEKIFYRSEAEKEKDQIKEVFDKMNMYVLNTRGRIEEYVAWERKMRGALEEQKRVSLPIKPTINELEDEIAQIALACEKAKDDIKTPPYCAGLTEKVGALAVAKLSDEEKEEQCKQFGRQIRAIGGAQDTLLAVCRSTVKVARQYATVKLMTSSDAGEKELLNNFRRETGVILNHRFGIEGK